jgi:hypothetical protein
LPPRLRDLRVLAQFGARYRGADAKAAVLGGDAPELRNPLQIDD